MISRVVITSGDLSHYQIQFETGFPYENSSVIRIFFGHSAARAQIGRTGRLGRGAPGGVYRRCQKVGIGRAALRAAVIISVAEQSCDVGLDPVGVALACTRIAAELSIDGSDDPLGNPGGQGQPGAGSPVCATRPAKETKKQSLTLRHEARERRIT